jgi:hypothetical protein
MKVGATARLLLSIQRLLKSESSTKIQMERKPPVSTSEELMRTALFSSLLIQYSKAKI